MNGFSAFVSTNRSPRVCILKRTLRWAVAAILPLQVLGGAIAAAELTSEELSERQAIYEEIGTELDHFYAGLESIDRSFDKALFEIDALAKTLGPDPEASFAYVRDQIGYEPYLGMLRGARGALRSRAGNALDRSLLLAALLAANGHKAEIVRGHLDVKTAEKAAARLFDPVPQPEAVTDLETMLGDLLTQSGVDPEALADAVEQLGASQQADDAAALQRAESLLPPIVAALSSEGMALAGAVPRDQFAAEAADHYWVRLEDAAGVSLELDPTFPTSRPGNTFATETAVFTPDAVPSELQHRLSIRLRLAVQSANGDKQVDLIHEEFPVASAGDGIELGQTPSPAPDLQLAASGFAGEAIAGIHEFVPYLRVGDQRIFGQSFDLTGHLFDNPPGGDLGNAERLARQNEGGFGGLGGALGGIFGAESGPAAADRITGEWVEYELSSPTIAGPPALFSARRDIVPSSDPATVVTGEGSVVTAADRAVLQAQLYWSIEIGALTGAVSPQLIAYLSTRRALDQRDAQEALLRRLMGLAADMGAVSVDPMPVLDPLIFAENAERLEAMADRLAYRDRASLVAFEHRFLAHKGGATRLIESIDIVSWRLRQVPIGDSTETLLPPGMLETVLEDQMMGKRAATLGRDPASVSSSSAPLEAALAAGTPLVALLPKADNAAKFAGLGLGPAWVAEIETTLKAGQVVLVPASAVAGTETGWWSYAPETGAIIGTSPGGRGMSAFERLVLEAANAELQFALTAFLCSESIPKKWKRSDGLSALGGLMCGAVAFSAPIGAYGGARGQITAWVAIIFGLIIYAASQPPPCPNCGTEQPVSEPPPCPKCGTKQP